MLFVLPAGSWWYLNKGFDYRKQILEEIEIKSSLLENQGINESTKDQLRNLLMNKISVVVNKAGLNIEEKETVQKLEKKYGGRELFQVVNLEHIGAQNVTQLNKDIYLIDQELNIRNEYNFETESIKKLVEHIAALIPMPVREEVKLKRELIDD